MYYYVLYLILLGVIVKECESNQCGSTFINERGHEIELNNYCLGKPCVTKCCYPCYVLGFKLSCIPESKVPKRMKVKLEKIHLKDLQVYYWDDSIDDTKPSQKNFSSDFVFVYNEQFNDETCYYFNFDKHYVMEDGSLKVETPHSANQWMSLDSQEYCVDVWLNIQTREPQFAYKKLNVAPDEEANIASIISGVSIVVSSLFLLLVLLVYILLPQLQNIGGMMLMAYVGTLAAAYLLKAAQLLGIAFDSIDIKICSHLSPAYYFAIQASFLWMNVMSFDIWWTLRGTRKCRQIHRRGELVKFLWYALYAYGTAILMTVAAVIVDTPGVVTATSFVKPDFESCLGTDSVIYYLQIPVGILTASNCTLFFMTTYNIWVIRRRVDQCNESHTTKRNENRFKVYVKMSIVMGVSWVLEFLDFVTGDLPVWLFVLVNAYNMFIGIAVFFLFVFKKSILIMLCKREFFVAIFIERNKERAYSATDEQYNIENAFVKKLQESRYSRSPSSKTDKTSNNNKDTDDVELSSTLLMRK